MRKLGLAAVAAASIAAAGCATYPNQYGYDPYNNGYGNPYYNNGYNNGTMGRAATGAAVGALGGAIAGKNIPGVNTTTGAVAGMGAGTPAIAPSPGAPPWKSDAPALAPPAD